MEPLLTAFEAATSPHSSGPSWLLEMAAENAQPPVQSAWALFAIVTALLVIFVATVAVLAVTRHWRRTQAPPSASQPADSGTGPDPWVEAGRRTRVEESGNE